MTTYFMDGRYTKQDGLTISIDDRGYYFGDGVYEVVKVYDGKLFTANEHFDRLLQSAEKIKVIMPYTVEQLIEIAEELIVANSISTGHIYLQVTRGEAKRAHHFPSVDVKPVVTAYAINNPRPMQAFETGVAVKSVADIRWLRCDIKSLNLLPNVLAKQEAQEADCAEALLHRDGVVTEGSSSNMYGIKNGVIYTHPATNLILNGITRQVVQKVCDKLGIAFEERAFTLEEAYQMDEFFLTSTTAEVTPVITIDNLTIGTGKPGPLTMKLQEAFNLEIPTSNAGE